MSTLLEHKYSFLIQNWRMMNCVVCLIFLMLIPFSLVGCFPLPSTKAFEEKPFLGEEVSSIEVGITTKTEVEFLLGAPDATRRNSTIYIYAEPYIYGYLIVVPEMRRLEKHHLLIVQFDKDEIVKYVDHIVGNGSCTQNGICIGDTGLRAKMYLSSYISKSAFPLPHKTRERSIEQMLVLYSNRITSFNSLKFVPQEKAAIYVYRGKKPFQTPSYRQKVTVSLDRIEAGDFGKEGFFYWVVDPGNHSITVTPLWPGQEGQTGGWHSASINIESKEGLIYFVEQTWESEGIFKTQIKVRLAIVSDQSLGRREVLKRKMVLDCLSQGD